MRTIERIARILPHVALAIALVGCHQITSKILNAAEPRERAAWAGRVDGLFDDARFVAHPQPLVVRTADGLVRTSTAGGEPVAVTPDELEGDRGPAPRCAQTITESKARCSGLDLDGRPLVRVVGCKPGAWGAPPTTLLGLTASCEEAVFHYDGGVYVVALASGRVARLLTGQAVALLPPR